MKQLFLLGIVLSLVVFSCKKEETTVVSAFSEDTTYVDLSGEFRTGDNTSYAFS